MGLFIGSRTQPNSSIGAAGPVGLDGVPFNRINRQIYNGAHGVDTFVRRYIPRYIEPQGSSRVLQWLSQRYGGGVTGLLRRVGNSGMNFGLFSFISDIAFHLPDVVRAVRQGYRGKPEAPGNVFQAAWAGVKALGKAAVNSAAGIAGSVAAVAAFGAMFSPPGLIAGFLLSMAGYAAGSTLSRVILNGGQGQSDMADGQSGPCQSQAKNPFQLSLHDQTQCTSPPHG